MIAAMVAAMAGAEIATVYEADWAPTRFDISDQVQPLKRNVGNDELLELQDLHDAGEQIQWPDGFNEQTARELRRASEAITKPPFKRLRQMKPERERNTDSTLGVASATVDPPAAAAFVRRPAPHIVWALGPGHDLRLSGGVAATARSG